VHVEAGFDAGPGELGDAAGYAARGGLCNKEDTRCRQQRSMVKYV
jgi:hypothetical protein